MAAYEKYDERVDSLVVEKKTHWDSSVASSLSAQDKEWLAAAIHKSPHLASKIAYERSHTGFTREITVTLQDIQRLYQERLG